MDANDRGQQQGVLAATEPGFEFTLDNKAIQLTWQNLEAVTVQSGDDPSVEGDVLVGADGLWSPVRQWHRTS